MMLAAAASDICPSSDQSMLEVVATGNEGFSNVLKRLQRICPGRLCPLDDAQVDMLEVIDSNESPLVVFVPTEEAFQSLLGSVNIRDILREPEAVEELQDILSYHVVREGATCEDILGPGVVQTLLDGATVEIDDESVVDGSGQRIGIMERIPASNGQVYLIDGLLLPGNVSSSLLTLSGLQSPSVE